MKRIDNWDQPFYKTLEEWEKKRFSYDGADCLAWICAMVEAITGEKVLTQYLGTYHSKEESEALLAKEGGYAPALTATFGDPVRATLAHRGDVVLYIVESSDGKREFAGIATGMRATFITKRGFMHIPLQDCAQAWRVG